MGYWTHCLSWQWNIVGQEELKKRYTCPYTQDWTTLTVKW